MLHTEPLVLHGRGSTLSLQELVAAAPSLGTAAELSFRPVLQYHATKKPLAKVKHFDRRFTQRVLRNSTAADLIAQLRWLASENDLLIRPDNACLPQTWVYFSATNDSATAQFVRDRVDIADLAQLAGARAGRPDGATIHSENVWIGGAGVTSWNHYDASWNAFAQLNGRKRFVLSAPAVGDRLQPYSYLHPHFRRTQQAAIDVDGADRGVAGTTTVVLEAGDVLVLPPFYFHMVTALSPVSVSYNVWAHDGATLRVQRLVSRGGRALGLLPALNDPAFSREARAAILEHFAVALAGALFVDEDAAGDSVERAARAWLHARLSSRWRSVKLRYPRPLAKLQRFCAPGEAQRARSALAKAHAPAGAASAVEAAAAALRAVRPVGGDVLEAPNLIEQAAVDVLGDVKAVGSFLSHCFA